MWLWPWLGILLWSIGLMLYRPRHIPEGDTLELPLATWDKAQVWIMAVFNPFVTGIVLYFGWRTKLPKMAQQARRISIITFIVEVVLMIVLIAVFFVGAYLRSGISLGPAAGNMSEKLLGTWQSKDKSSDASIYFRDDYLGFVDTPDGKFVRGYEGSGALNADMLYEVYRWDVLEKNGELLLDEVDYDDPSMRDLRQTFRVSMPTDGQLVLEEQDADGTVLETQRYVRVRDAVAERAMDFTRSAEQDRDICANVLDDEHTEYPMSNVLLPLSCNKDMGKSEGVLTYRLEENGVFNVLRGDKTIFTLDENDSEDGATENFPILFLSPRRPFLRPTPQMLMDVTYDGYPDLVVLTGDTADGYSNSYYAYNPDTHTFDKKPILANIVNPGVDVKARLVASHDTTGGSGDTYTENVYHFENGTYVLIRTIRQEIAPATGGGYIRTTQELRSGKMVTVSTQRLSAEEVQGTPNPFGD